MLKKRIIPCLDIRNNMVVKGQQFKEVRDIADPLLLAKKYNQSGADELVFYDITASIEQRSAFVDLVSKIARELTIPFTVGGGIQKVSDFKTYLRAGADKISVNSGAFINPSLIQEASYLYGNQCVVLSVDVKKHPDGYFVYKKGGRENTGIAALPWIKENVKKGAGEVVVNTIHTDGMQNGYDLEFLKEVCNTVSVPVIASGGAGAVSDFLSLFKETDVDGALAASVFHNQIIHIQQLKTILMDNNIPIRLPSSLKNHAK